MLSAIVAVAVSGIVVFGIVIPRSICAQSTGRSTPSAFEVASIKPDQSGSGNRFIGFSDPGRYRATNIPAVSLIEIAYNVQRFQLSGGPSWINSQTYDVEAKVDESVVAELQKLSDEQKEDRVRAMLRSLLADRFKLKVNQQKRELPIFALVIAKGGAKLTPTALSPASANTAGQHSGWGIFPGKLKGTAITMNELARVLESQPVVGGRVIINDTKMDGSYDLTLEWAPDSSTLSPRATGGDQASDNPPLAQTTGPSIFTALQEQLGLKLERRKGPVDTVIIEHIEKPSEN